LQSEKDALDWLNELSASDLQQYWTLFQISWVQVMLITLWSPFQKLLKIYLFTIAYFL